MVVTDRPAQPSEYWEQLDTVAGHLYAWICLRLRAPTRRLADPDDVFQEVALRGHQVFGQLQEQESFRAWIFGIARNVLREQLRSLAVRARPVEDSSSAGNVDDLAEELTSISRRVAKGEEIQRLLATVATLEAEDRLLVLHRGLEDLTYREIGELLGIGEEAAKKRWQRLRTRIQSSLW